MRGIFFDLYGTLLIYGDMKSAWSEWLATFHSRLRLLGLSQSMESFSGECNRFFGKEEPPRVNDGFTVFERRIRCLCERAGLRPGADEVASIADHIAEVWQRHMRVDEDAPLVLDALHRSWPLALVSNFDHPRHVMKVLSSHQLTGFFQSVVISGDVGVGKPDPRIFDLALSQTGLSPAEVVYVGDTEEDVRAAQAAGISPILIQRPTNAPDPDALDFRSADDAQALERRIARGVDTTRIASLKELLPLFL